MAQTFSTELNYTEHLMFVCLALERTETSRKLYNDSEHEKFADV